MDVKQALLDSRFREKLPVTLQNDVSKFLQNPHCACNHPIYIKMLKEVPELLREYYPNKTPMEVKEHDNVKNNWSVINCTIYELEGKLQALGPGQKHVEIARYQDQVTVIINEIDTF